MHAGFLKGWLFLTVKGCCFSCFWMCCFWLYYMGEGESERGVEERDFLGFCFRLYW